MRLIGINYKDEPEAARRFLARHGNPFDAIGADTKRPRGDRLGRLWRPETYVVDGRGRIAFKFVGPLSASVIESKSFPPSQRRKTPYVRDAQS